MSYNMEKLILDGTQYGGLKKPEGKSLSASQLNDEPLLVWLRYKYGVRPTEKITMATIGTLVHGGMEAIIKNGANRLEAEVELAKKMPCGWTLRGTADIVDRKDKIVYDIKVIKKYRIEKFEQNGIDDPYTWQLNAYRYLLKQSGSEYDMRLLTLSPDAGLDYKTGIVVPTMRLVPVPYINDADIEEKFRSQVEALKEAIENDKPPKKCQDLTSWIRYVNKKKVQTKCLYYCDYRDICPRINEKDENVLSAWGF
jgi:hypothetical protein